MVVALLKRITSWSYSRYKDYKNCPLMAKFKFVDKVKVEDTRAQAGGASMHELASEWATKKTSKGLPSKMKKIPAELKAFAEEFDELRNSKLAVIAESDPDPFKMPGKAVFAKFAWGITRDWVLCDFFDKERVWCRLKIDTHTWNHETKTVRVIDYKSGRIYPDDHKDQADLYAIGAFIKYPDALRVRMEFWYTDQQQLVPYEYLRKALPLLQKKWTAKVVPMLADTRFAAKPGRHCTWCGYGVSKGGTCEHG
jgi:hypothetical protein